MAALHDRESALTIKGDVIFVQPLARDANDRKLFSVKIEDLKNRDRNLSLKADVNRIQVIFYDEWADACCFLSVGDSLTVHHFSIDASVGDDAPFVAIVNPNSEITAERHRSVFINALNVGKFEYQEEALRHNQTYQSLLVRGHNQFTRCGPFYDAMFGTRAEKPRFAFLLSILNSYFVRTVLDCGCGTGLFSFYLQHNGMIVTGMDCSETMLEVAKGKNDFMAEGQKIPFHRADISDFKLVKMLDDQESEMFDCVICMDVLLLLPDMDRVRLAIRKFWYHVRSEGHLILDIPNHPLYDKGPLQTVLRVDLQRQNLDALGSNCVLEEGVLDVIQRAYKDKDRRVHEWYGYAQQYSKQRKLRYFTNWTERYPYFHLKEIAKHRNFYPRRLQV